MTFRRSGKLAWATSLVVMVALIMTLTGCNFQEQEKFGTITGWVIDEHEEPIEGVVISIEETGQTAITSPEGFFSFTEVREGTATLDVKHKEKEIPEAVKVNVTVEIVIVIKIKVEVKPGNPAPPEHCKATPWAGVVASADGRGRVVAGGGKNGGDCTEPITVTITGPGYVFSGPGPVSKVIDPAANGLWQVKVEVCGRTKTVSATSK